jgi:hypothetical protein
VLTPVAVAMLCGSEFIFYDDQIALDAQPIGTLGTLPSGEARRFCAWRRHRQHSFFPRRR